MNEVEKTADMLRSTFVEKNIRPSDALKAMTALILALFHEDGTQFDEWIEDMVEIRKKMKEGGDE